MSGQFPGGYQSPMSGHRGNFGNQVVNVNMVPNQMNLIGYNQSGMLPQQQSQLQNQSLVMSGHGNTNDPSSPAHMQQQKNQPLQQQQQKQQQTPQLGLPSNSSTASGGNPMSQQSIQQQQQSQTSTSAPQLPQKEINTVSLTKLGQETVQDITSRFQEIFSALKTIQPTGNRENSTEKKVQEYFRTIRLLFKRLRIIYEKSSDGCSQGMEFTHVESLIPYKDEPEQTRTESTQCEEYRKALQENRELTEIAMLKNKQLREIIDRTRIIIWEINTMLSIRRS